MDRLSRLFPLRRKQSTSLDSPRLGLRGSRKNGEDRSLGEEHGKRLAFSRHGLEKRGTGYADTVTEEGWKGFKENSTKAAEFFTKAWEIDPKLPYAAAAMIEVAMSGDDKLSSRDWFDRAVAAQMDYKLAYNHYLWSIRPRWGGSHKKMYQFGLECLATKRFDTAVPEKFIQVCLDIDSELGGKGEVWRKTGVFANIKKLMEGLENEPSRRANSNPMLNTFEVTLSTCFLIALDAGKYDEAKYFG